MYAPALPFSLMVGSLLSLLIVSVEESSGQARGVVYYHAERVSDTLLLSDTGEVSPRAMISGDIIGVGEDAIGVETLEGRVVIRRSQILRVKIIRRSYPLTGITASLIGAHFAGYVSSLGPSGSGGMFGMGPAFFPSRYPDAAESMLLVLTGLTLPGLFGIVAGNRHDHHEEYSLEGADDRTWQGFVEDLTAAEETEWSLRVAGGVLHSGTPDRILRYHSRIAPIDENPPFVIHIYPDPTSLQMLRSLEVVRSVCSGIEVGVGAYDLSLGVRSSYLAVSPELTAYFSTQINGSGYGGVVQWEPLDRFISPLLDLRIGGSIGPAIFAVEQKSGQSSGFEHHYFAVRPYVLVSGELAINMYDRLYVGFRADAATTFVGTTPEYQLADLPQDEDGIDLSSTVLGFVIGYSF